MVDQATAKYLSDNIGGVLAKALGEMAVAQPRDGVEYLAKWLSLHVEQEEARASREQEEAKLLEERAKAQERLAEQTSKKNAREKELQRKEDAFKDFLEKLKDPETNFEESFWAELLAVASTLTGAKAGYLGLVDEEGLDGVAGPLIRYTEVLPGSELMHEKVLMQGQGVTWGAVTENPTEEVLHLWKPPQPEPAEPNPDDPDAPPAEPPVVPYLPVSVECVTDVKETHYFDMTRLGAYLAVPMVYSSYYTSEAFADCKKFEDESKALAAKRAEIQKTYDEAVEAQGDDAADPVERPPDLDAVDERVMALPGKVVKMVMCMDTLGTNTAIDEGCFERALELCQAFGKCKQETETRLLRAQAVSTLDVDDRTKMEEAITAARTRAEEETAETVAVEEAEVAPDAEEQAKELVAKKWAYMRAARVFLEMQDTFLGLNSWVVPSPETMGLIESAALFFGYKKHELYPKRKASLDWQVLRRVLDSKFCKTIQDADPAAPRKGLEEEQKLPAVKAKRPDGFDSEKAKEVSPALELLSVVLDTATEYRTAKLQLQRAEYEKRKAASQEGEEPAEFTEAPLEEGDDDFEGLAPVA